MQVAQDDPLRPDVRALLERHLALMRASSPPEDVHALPVEALLDPAVRFVSCRDDDGALLAVGALKQLPGDHAEVKSMHTAQEARGRGAARAVLDHLLAVARERGARRVSLETGTQEVFAPARALYVRAGFAPCPPFGDYRAGTSSAFFTRAVGA